MPPDLTRHLTPEIVAAWAEGTLQEPDRTVAEEHLSGCADCRRELIEVERILATAPARGRRFPLPFGVAAAAAVLLAVGIPASRALVDLTPEPSAQRARQDGPVGLTVVAPRPDDRVASVGSFTWKAVDAGSRFRVTLVDEHGATLWTTETGDTVATLPPDVVLGSGRTYFWYVDALGADGRSLTSGAQRFTVR